MQQPRPRKQPRPPRRHRQPRRLPQPPRPDLLLSLRQALNPGRDDRPVLILGVGSELRSDDAAGVRVAARVAALARGRGLRGLQCISGGPAPENATAEIRRISPSLVVFVDAADMGEPAGTIRVLDSSTVGGASTATHGLSLAVLADYLRAEMGCRVSFVGIQPASVAHGPAMSDEAASAVEELAQALIECLG